MYIEYFFNVIMNYLGKKNKKKREENCDKENHRLLQLAKLCLPPQNFSRSIYIFSNYH